MSPSSQHAGDSLSGATWHRHRRLLCDPAERAIGIRKLFSVDVLLCSCRLRVAYRRSCLQEFFGGMNVSYISSGPRVVQSLEPALPR